MRKFILTRHGETFESLNMTTQGQKDTKLTENGVIQASVLGSYLSGTYPINQIFTSDLSRALDTAEIIAAKYNHQININQSPLIREISCGIYEGEPFESLINFRKIFSANPENAKPPNGESFLMLRKRVNNWLSSFLAQLIETSLVVTHRGPISVISESINLSAGQDIDRNIYNHCCATIINVDESNNIFLNNVINPSRSRNISDPSLKGF